METTTKTRTLSTAAKAAKAIREELKRDFPEIKFSVKSSNYSMGNSVTISYTDGVPAGIIEEITGKYQYGHFDGMDDSYKLSNSREDIPQSKYVSVSRHMSDEAQALMIKLHNEMFCEECQISDDMNEMNKGMGSWNSDVVYRAFIQYDFLKDRWIPNSDYGSNAAEMELHNIVANAENKTRKALDLASVTPEEIKGTKIGEKESIQTKDEKVIELKNPLSLQDAEKIKSFYVEKMRNLFDGVLDCPDEETEQAKKMNDLRFACEAALGLVETLGIISNSNKAHAELIKKLLKSALQ